jgi:hypothetical protein
LWIEILPLFHLFLTGKRGAEKFTFSLPLFDRILIGNWSRTSPYEDVAGRSATGTTIPALPSGFPVLDLSLCLSRVGRQVSKDGSVYRE